MEKPVIAITQGDTNGVGLEMILKTFECEEMLDICTPVIYGSPKIATFHRKQIGSQTSFVVRDSYEQIQAKSVNMINPFGEEEVKIEMGQPTQESGQAALRSLVAALKDMKEGRGQLLVTAPLTRSNVQKDFPGTTMLVEKALGKGSKALNILIHDNLRVALATTNLPLSAISEQITKENIAEKLQILENTLKRDFMIDNPRIAVLSLNPRCGEEGLFGTEEQEIIKPTIDELFGKGVHCFGPYAADELFGSNNYQRFDAILAMYHDQGITPFKALCSDEGVSYIAGMPVIVCAPAVGPDFNNAGKNIVMPDSMREAIYTAIDIERNRVQYDRAHQNPLRRQYFEKRDDSDKLKLDQVTEDDAL